MKKKLACLISCTLVLMLFLTGCGNSTSGSSGGNSGSGSGESGYDNVTLKLGMSGTERGVDYYTGEYLADALEEASGGSVKLELYPNNILSGGSQPEAINLLTQGGAMEMGLYSAAVFANLDPKFQVCMLPFIFEDYQHVDEVMDSTGNVWYSEQLAEYGLVNLGNIHCGIKQWTNNEEEKHAPEDFVNFKMRIPGGEVSQMTWQAFGADPVTMSWSEVYTALQQGTIDGHENGYQTLWSNNIQEVQKYITEANYIYDGYWLVFNENDWNKLSEKTQELIREKAAEAIAYGRKYLEDDEARIKQELIEGGNVVTELTAEERQAFVEATQSVRDYFKEQFGADAFAAMGIE